MTLSHQSTLPQVVLLGGNSLVAPHILPRLQATGAAGIVLTRQMCDTVPNFKIHQLNLQTPGRWLPAPEANIISLVPLEVLAESLSLFSQCRCIVALASTSSISREKSASAKDRALAAKLQLAEKKLTDWSQQTGVPVVLLRSTMIYDCKRDRNVTRLAKFMLRIGFIPLAQPASGLRQPIHADDVAAIITEALTDPARYAGFHTIAGGEVLTYRAMVERIAAALPRPVRIRMLPLWLLRLTFGVGARLGIIREQSFDAEIFARMNQDLIFDQTSTVTWSLQPRAFAPQFR